jgi:hypothetical protein
VKSIPRECTGGCMKSDDSMAGEPIETQKSRIREKKSEERESIEARWGYGQRREEAGMCKTREMGGR